MRESELESESQKVIEPEEPENQNSQREVEREHGWVRER